jgi:hypothetical protein
MNDRRRRQLRALLGVGVAAVVASLFMPWIVGHDSGRYTVAGWEARPLYTAVMVVLWLAQAMIVLDRDLLWRARWAPPLLAGVSLASTLWVRTHNDYYEVPELGYGYFVSLAAQAAFLLGATALAFGSRRIASPDRALR